MSISNASAKVSDEACVRAMVQADGGSLYTEQRGCGDALVCIPGAGGDAAIFQHLARTLSDTHTVLTYDRRGNSRSRFRARNSAIADHADDVIRIMDAFEIERASLFAQSMGSAIALKLLLNHPERLAAIILHEPFWFPTFVVDPARVRELIENGIGAIQEHHGKTCAEFEARIRYFGGESFIASLDACATARIFGNAAVNRRERITFSSWTPNVDELRAFRSRPIDLLIGNDTHFFFADVVHAFEAALDRKAHVVPGGHGGFSDNPEAVAAHVARAMQIFNAGAVSHSK